MVNENLLASTDAAEIYFGVATEILFFRDRGFRYAGPLPDEMKMALDYESVMLRNCQKTDAVEMRIAFLKTEESQNLFAQTGVD